MPVRINTAPPDALQILVWQLAVAVLAVVWFLYWVDFIRGELRFRERRRAKTYKIETARKMMNNATTFMGRREAMLLMEEAFDDDPEHQQLLRRIREDLTHASFRDALSKIAKLKH